MPGRWYDNDSESWAEHLRGAGVVPWRPKPQVNCHAVIAGRPNVPASRRMQAALAARENLKYLDVWTRRRQGRQRRPYYDAALRRRRAGGKLRTPLPLPAIATSSTHTSFAWRRTFTALRARTHRASPIQRESTIPCPLQLQLASRT